MNWIELRTGRFSGKTLPQVVLADPDWFYYWVETANLVEPLRQQARDIFVKSQRIRIPERNGRRMIAEYHQYKGSFCRLRLVPAVDGLEYFTEAALLLPHIDLSVPRRWRQYDKTGNKAMVSELKPIVTGDANKSFTKARCEAFFADDSNFVLV